MGFQEVASLDCDNAIQLGGKDRKTGKAHPTKIEGYYIGSKNVPSAKSKTGFTKLHIFLTEKGNLGVWGKTDLDRKLAGVTAGVMTRVTYTGMKETKNNPMYVYKVEVDNDNTTDVSAASEESSDETYEEATESSYEETEVEEENDPGEEESLPDEVPPARARPPKAVAAAPSATQQAKVKALLAGRKQAS